MPTLTAAAVRKQIAAGATDAVYLLAGDDDIEKSALAGEFSDLVEEDLRAFNVERIHAGDWTSGDRLADGVAASLSRRGTSTPSAWSTVTTRRGAIIGSVRAAAITAATRALEALESLLKDPERQTTLVFVAGTVDKRSRMYKLLQRQATIVECGAIADQADAERWVRTRIAAGGAEIDPAAARLLVTRAGVDVRRLRGEVDRLLLYTLGQKRIGVEDARAIAGPAALLDDWALTNAIEAGQAGEALRQLALMLDAGTPPEKILGQLGWLVRAKFPQLSPAEVRRAIDALFRTDQDLKRSAGDPRVLLERLVVELCTPKR